MAFKYRSLAENHIRLLEVWQPHGDELRYLAFSYNLQNLPDYTAISYRWGDEPPSKSVFLDGTEFRVRANLWRALRYLRLHGKSRYIWVDAICIDQRNVAERNTQVHLMDRIYSKATNVAVWLGSDVKGHSYEKSLYRIGKVEDIEKYVEGGTGALAARTYWSRMWVVQEFLLAKRITVFGDGFCMDWTLLRAALTELPARDVPATIKPFLRRMRHEYYGTPKRPLRNLLFAYRRSQCKDPRDKVFAILSLMQFDERRVLGRFFPNYSLSVDDVVTITLSHLRGQPGQDIGDKILDLFGFDNDVHRQRILRASAQLSVTQQAKDTGKSWLYPWCIPSIPWWTSKPHKAISTAAPTPQPTDGDEPAVAGQFTGGNDENAAQKDYVLVDTGESRNDGEETYIVDSYPDLGTIVLANPMELSLMDLKWELRRARGPLTSIEALLFQINSLFPSAFWLLLRVQRLTRIVRRSGTKSLPRLVVQQILPFLRETGHYIVRKLFSFAVFACWAACGMAYASYLISGILFLLSLL